MDYILEPLIKLSGRRECSASTVSNRAERKVYLIVAIFQTACLFAAAFAMRRKTAFKTESGDNQTQLLLRTFRSLQDRDEEPACGESASISW